MGNWVANAHRLSDERIDKFTELEDYLYVHASHYGLADLTFTDSDSGKIYPSSELEFDDEVLECIDEYANETFWDELAERLALRDALKIYSEEQLIAMDPSERIITLTELEDHYNGRFMDEGLENLELKEFNFSAAIPAES